jgi:hypothetical protein
MTNSEIERAVARATGESRRVISRYGFSLLSEEPDAAADVSLALDCPGCGARHDTVDVTQPSLELECSRCDAIYPIAIGELYVADGPPPGTGRLCLIG